MKKRLAPSPADATELRRRAEARLKDRKQAQAGKGAAPPSADENQRLLQELQIHQIELEMQNENLRRIQGDMEASQARYFDLYDLAPVGYLTLSKKGLILEVNLTASTLLGVARSALIGKPFTRFILPEDHGIYHEHYKLSFETGASHVCEVRMVRVDAAPRWIRIDTIAAEDADGAPICRSTMIDITDRKQSEKALRESEEKYRILFENAGEAIFVAQDGKMVFLNPMTTAIIGYSNEELASRPFTDFIHADDRDMVMDRYVRRLRGEKVPRRYSFRILHKKGGFRWVDLDTVKINWQERPATLNFMTDITERKRAEEALHQSDYNYRFLFENAGEGILIAQGDIIKFANPALEKILGYPRDVITSKPFVSFIHPDDRAMLVDRHMKRMSGEPVETGYRFRSIAPDGTQRWLHIISRLTSWNGMPASLSFVMDITEHKRAEDELRASEEKYRLIFEYSPLGLLSFDEQGAIIACNNNFVKIIGSSREKLIGLNMLKLPNEKVVLAVKNALMGSPGFYEGDYSSVTAKKITPIRCLFAPMDLGGGQISGGVGIIEDITERKLSEEHEKETHALLRIAGEKAKLGGWSANLEDNRVVWSDEVAAIHEMPAGYSPLVEQGISFYAPQWRERITKVFTDCAQEGIPYDEEMEIITTNGKRVWVRTIGEAVKNDAGKIIKVQGAFQDITERKQAEEALRESENRYYKLFERMTSGVAIYEAVEDGADFIIRNFNAAAEQMEKIGRKEVLGKRVTEVFPGVRDFGLFSVFQRVWESGNSESHDISFYQDNRISGWRENHIYKLPSGEIVAIYDDVTARKQAEESLQQAEENYRSIFENAQEGIYRTTLDGKFLMANQAMARILGYDSPKELLAGISDITHQLYVHPEERVKTLELLERQGFVKDAELQWNRKDGSTIWVYRTIQAIHNERGQLLYIEGLVTDITDRKNSVDQLRKALGGTIQAIASVVETKDPYTAGHQRRVADLARTIATEMGFSQEQIEGLRVAGTIHDIGKVSVPAEILSSPRKLTNLEFSLIKTHVQAGYDILKDIEFPWPIARMVLEHHERMNGSGYPNGLTGDDILPESRILAVADVVEAMATHRPYRAALGLNAALQEITQNKGLLYDPEAVEACLCLFREKGYEIKG